MEFRRIRPISGHRQWGLRELEPHLVVVSRLGFLADLAVAPLLSEIDDLPKMLYGLRVRLNATIKATPMD